MPIVKTNLSGEDTLLSGTGKVVEVDAELSETSENPLQNKAVYAQFVNVANSINELYDNIPSSTLLFKDTVVSTTSWISDATYTDYPYKADIPCEGVTADYVADVIFALKEATSDKFAPVTLTGDGIVTIYAKEIPSADITIPTIKCEKVVSFL